MSSTLSGDYRGLNLRAIADTIDRIFEFQSDWQALPEVRGGSHEFQGRIVVDLSQVDRLCDFVDAGPGDRGHVFRYVLAHLKSHHYQELYPTYSKPYVEDIRPYELEADLIAGWICANAQIPNAFRTHGMAREFSDFGRMNLMLGHDSATSRAEHVSYIYPEERELAFRRGARMWATGQVSQYSQAAVRQGMHDETFHEFMAEVPSIINSMWSRPLPQTVLDERLVNQVRELEDRIPVASGRARS